MAEIATNETPVEQAPRADRISMAQLAAAAAEIQPLAGTETGRVLQTVIAERIFALSVEYSAEGPMSKEGRESLLRILDECDEVGRGTWIGSTVYERLHEARAAVEQAVAS